jgi:hypothetical protein
MARARPRTDDPGRHGQPRHQKARRQVNKKEARDHQAVADRAVKLYVNPLASVPSLTGLMVGDVLDRARLAALAGETALAAGNHEWLKKSATRMRKLAAKLPAVAHNEVASTGVVYEFPLVTGVSSWS